MKYVCLLLVFAISSQSEAKTSCSTFAGNFTLSLERKSGPNEKEPLYDLVIKAEKAHSSLNKVQLSLSGTGFTLTRQDILKIESGKETRMRVSKADLEGMTHLLIHPPGDIDSASPYAAVCPVPVLKGTFVITGDPNEETGVPIETLFSDEKTTSACKASYVQRQPKPGGLFCRYSMLTAAHCLRGFNEGKTAVNLMKMIVPTLGLVDELEIATHPLYKPKAEAIGKALLFKSYHDVGIISFEARCLSDQEITVYPIADRPADLGEACTVLGENAFLAVPSLGDIEGDFEIDWSHEKTGMLNEGRESPKPGWSGSAVIATRRKRREIVGCYHSHDLTKNGDKKESGYCAGMECLSWVSKKLNR